MTDSSCYTCLSHRQMANDHNKKSLKIPKGGNQNLYIEEEQTTQCPPKKGQKTIYKTYI